MSQANSPGPTASTNPAGATRTFLRSRPNQGKALEGEGQQRRPLRSHAGAGTPPGRPDRWFRTSRWGRRFGWHCSPTA
jgi:hypothetical protein